MRSTKYDSCPDYFKCVQERWLMSGYPYHYTLRRTVRIILHFLRTMIRYFSFPTQTIYLVIIKQHIREFEKLAVVLCFFPECVSPTPIADDSA